ncbi:DUF4974 domain-containing protein [Olivibacter ginsenosidimutans]|uniref:DUF4974 domain-containing protein n=1 Tax=Olivibacter ginsenosidimutans TaxID=1176537 RepID=A0ABP9ABK2_9SPHI
MPIKEERFIALLTAYIHEQINEAEFEELINLVQQADTDQEDEQLASLFDKAWQQANQQLPIKLDAERVFRRIMTAPQLNTPAQTKRPRIWLIAASIAALLCLAALLYRQSISQLPKKTRERLLTQKKEAPVSGKRAVMLTLSNGHQIPVSALGEGVQTLQSGGRVQRNQNQLIYTEDQHVKANASPAFHTITTPVGMDYTLTLSDGTHVQLNAGSSITYPIAFHQQERKVELQGEAYFDVAKHPNQAFLVQAKGTHIRVLGTAFNVKAYQEERYVVTTLLTGGVKVQSKVLRPGQQALSNEDGNPIAVREVDVEEATAWRKGYFVFDQDDIKKVMNTLARWYDIDVVYNGNLAGKTFGGTLSRYTDFHQLLYAIERTGSVKFTIEGRRVIVSP